MIPAAQDNMKKMKANFFPKGQENDQVERRQETKIMSICISLAIWHAMHFSAILYFFENTIFLSTAYASSFKTEVAFEFIALLPLLGLAVAPIILKRFKGIKLFRDEKAAMPYAKNYATLTFAFCVYLIEAIVIILDCLTASTLSKFRDLIKYLVINSLHILAIAGLTAWLTREVYVYYLHNKERGEEFDRMKKQAEGGVVDKAQGAINAAQGAVNQAQGALDMAKQIP